jgi:hypothetical protein
MLECVPMSFGGADFFVAKVAHDARPMQIDLINGLIGLTFVAIWAMVGEIIVHER